MTGSGFVAVLAAADLPAGQMRCVDVDGTPVLLVRTKDGSLHALHNICTHAHTRMDEGRLRGDRLVCPLHGAGFDARTGAVLSGPATQPLPCYAVRVANGRIEVRVDPA